MTDRRTVDLLALSEPLVGMSIEELVDLANHSTDAERSMFAEAMELPDSERSARNHLGVWAEQKRGFVNAPFHWEWYRLLQMESRLCLVAPRDHAKSECVTVNQIAWKSTYQPLHWSFIFALTGDLAKDKLERVNVALEQTAPWMLDPRQGAGGNVSEWTYANGSKVTVAGAGKSVRGAHPDLIVGDDVLDEENTMTHHQRKKIERWWLGTVSGMTHPGTPRFQGERRFWMPPTKIFLVGTPFHSQDLLMTLRDNPLWRWRRYAAEYAPEDLRAGLAVEAA